MSEVPCQNCKKKKVWVADGAPMFGVFCTDCTVGHSFDKGSAPASPDLGVEEEAKRLAASWLDGFPDVEKELAAFGQKMFERGYRSIVDEFDHENAITVTPPRNLLRERDEALLWEAKEALDSAIQSDYFDHVLDARGDNCIEDCGKCRGESILTKLQTRLTTGREGAGAVCKHENGTWFDRSISYLPDGTEDGMHDRCNDCGEILCCQEKPPTHKETGEGGRPRNNGICNDPTVPVEEW